VRASAWRPDFLPRLAQERERGYPAMGPLLLGFFGLGWLWSCI
jgi:hypothetical protein